MSSLDRLKTLDSLPDLVLQLQEAKQLCDHRARAEMILKWLMGKLKTSDEAREIDESWNLLASTVRLLPIQRFAVLAAGLMPALEQTWATPELSLATIYAIARLLSILLELGQSVDGAAVKSLLSVKGDAAAMMCGDWWRHIHRHFSKNESINPIANDGLLDPALRLWDLRKHTESDDISFNDHCLVPILLLLAPLRNASTSTSVKRKRGQTVAIAITPTRYAHVLEALIARHTILPARTIFNRKHEQQPRRAHVQRLAKQPTIDERLSKLKEAVSSTSEMEDTAPESLCLVLDIALRSVSTPTPRHRFAERPWIAALFSALVDCVSSQTRQVVNRSLIELLETVRRNGLALTGMSAQQLTELVKNNALPEANSEDGIDWRLVAKIVQLDPDVLTNPVIAETLFSAISDVDDHQSQLLITTWRDEIIIPTMKAFAQARSLLTFMELWHKQLVRSAATNGQSVWESLDMPFAKILEERMLADQIIEQIDRFYTPVEAVVVQQSKLTHESVASTLVANIVVMRALLRGTRSDDLVLKLQDRLGRMFHTFVDLANLKGFKATIATSAHYWILVTRAFHLWFPLWATKQDDDAAVEREGVAILTGKAFKYALVQCSISESGRAEDHVAQTASAARELVASLCACFQQYGEEKGCADRCAEAMKQITKDELSAASTLVHRQTLLSSLDLGTRHTLISSPALLTAAAERDEQVIPTPFQALLTSSRGTGKQPTVEDAVSVILKHLSQGEKTAVSEQVLVSSLASINASLIEQTQRVNIIEAISQLPEVPADQKGTALLQARLALLLKLLNHPCQNAQLLTDPMKLWDLASLVGREADAGSSPSTSRESFETLQLLEAVIRSVLSSLLSTQDREKSQKVLVQFSQLVKDAIKLGAKGAKLSAHTGQLAYIKISLVLMEASAGDDLKSRLVHRSSKTARSWQDTLFAESLSYAGEKGSQLTTSQAKGVIAAFQALLDVPDSLAALSGVDKADRAEQLCKLAQENMSPSRIDGDEECRSQLLVVCFRLVCKHASNKQDLTMIAKEILEHDLKSRDLVMVIRSYAAAFERANAEWKSNAITFLTMEATSQRSSSLLLQQAAIRALNKEDAEGIPSSKDLVIHTLLAASSPDSSLAARRTTLQSLALVFKEKPFLTSQHTIEQTLATLQKLLSSNPASEIEPLYLNICHILTVILAHHRSRLQGRFHLLISILQQLISQLFRNNAPAKKTDQARSLAKLLESFCSPPAMRYRKGGKPSELVDEAKRAQAHAGQFAPYLLHFYCGCVLTGSSSSSLGGEERGAREALLPGLWAVIEAMEAYNEDAIRVLSSAATNSERAVLRSVYEEWKKMGKWEGV